LHYLLREQAAVTNATGDNRQILDKRM